MPNDYINQITDTSGVTFDIRDTKSQGTLFYGIVDGTSTSTAYTATIDGITEYRDGLTVVLKNGVVTSASGFTIDINNLGAKQAYSNMASATAETTIFNANYTMMFIYDSTRVAGGGWICYRGYNSDTNTIGYQLRTNSRTKPASDKGYRYRLWFTSADGTKFVPANKSSSTNATASRTPNTTPIDPFGEIIYYSTNDTTAANANLTATTQWQQYPFSLGYSFNTTGSALTLTFPAPVYIKCTPQSNGSATLDGYVQALPSTEDGKIYIYLGTAYSATNVELVMQHPVYYYKDSAIRLWTNAPSGGGGGADPATASPLMDGTASVGSSTKYAREDHIHPTDTGRASASHTHGNITNDGKLQTTDITIANGDKLVVTDSSNSNKVARASIAFDGSTTNQFLSKKGTWESAGGGGSYTITNAVISNLVYIRDECSGILDSDTDVHIQDVIDERETSLDYLLETYSAMFYNIYGILNNILN